MAGRKKQIAGQLSLEALSAAPEEDRDEQVRQAGSGSLQDSEPNPVRPDSEPGRVLREAGGAGSGRLNVARNQSEEIVRYELLSPPETKDEEEYENPSIKEHLEFMAEVQRLREQL